MRRILLAAVCSIQVANPSLSIAGGPCSGVPGGCGRSAYRASYSGGGPSSDALIDDPPRRCDGCKKHRTTARSKARTSVWQGTGSAPDDELKAPPVDKVELARLRADRVAKEKDRREREKQLTRDRQHFVMHLKSGKSHPVQSYRADGISYVVTSIGGGETRYPKSLVKSFTEVEPAVKTDVQQSEVADLPKLATVERVVDGDTIELAGGEKVRLIGVDTPETVDPRKPVEAFGKEASGFTSGRLTGERVKLDYDDANAAIKHRDKYGRLLAYITRDRDGLDFNAELVKQGYGHAYIKYPFARMEEFVGYEREAREKGKGLWAEQPELPRGTPDQPQESQAQGLLSPLTAKETAKPADNSSETVYVTKTGGKYHRAGCRHLSKSQKPISLTEAKQRYSPCKVCRPD